MIIANEERRVMLTAPAKVNLGLSLTGRLPNGYHGIRTVMTSLDFGDRVCVGFDDEGGHGRSMPGKAHISLTCPGSDLPCDERNLAYRAAKLLIEKFGLTRPIEIIIEKWIPVAAGLAGGSGDAAAVMTGMNMLFDLGLTNEELCELGVGLGADVPYCICRGTMLCEGIGEILTPLPEITGIPVLLVNPGMEFSTKDVYEAWDHVKDPYRPSIDALATFIRSAGQKGDPAGTVKITPETVKKLSSRLGNTFEPIAIKKFPEIGEIIDRLIELGACGALMSGTGPTVFGLFDYEDRMIKAAMTLNVEYGDDIFVQTAHTI